jgi:hypothetical protein
MRAYTALNTATSSWPLRALPTNKLQEMVFWFIALTYLGFGILGTTSLKLVVRDNMRIGFTWILVCRCRGRACFQLPLWRLVSKSSHRLFSASRSSNLS